MEEQSTKKNRLFRGREIILNILEEHEKSGLSIKAFCDNNNIATASFHNWKKKYGGSKVKPSRDPGFASLHIIPVAPVAEVLFAEVKGIKIYQRVEAVYLKQLLS